MTFVIKVRGSRMPMVAEYECPVHGRFDATVDRDENGDPPETHPCSASLFVDSADDCCHDCVGTCDQLAEHRMSAPRVKVKLFEVVRGGWAKPERPTWLDTRDLGEGQSLDEFHEKRAAIREEQRKADVMRYAREVHERPIGSD